MPVLWTRGIVPNVRFLMAADLIVRHVAIESGAEPLMTLRQYLPLRGTQT